MRIFSESQRFNQWWMIGLLILVSITMIYSIFSEFKKMTVIDSATMIILIASSVITFLMIGLIFMIKLKTRIDAVGISYQFFPFHLKHKLITWSELSKCYVRKYAPISEFGGWGYRKFGKKRLFGFKNSGQAINIKGDMGIQLEFKDGRKLLFGTQESTKAEQTIKTYIHKINSKSEF